MRLSDFRARLEAEFGRARASVLVADHVLSELGGRTAGQAIEDGVDLREVWFALCADLDVPRERWWGDLEPGRPRSRR